MAMNGGLRETLLRSESISTAGKDDTESLIEVDATNAWPLNENHDATQWHTVRDLWVGASMA